MRASTIAEFSICLHEASHATAAALLGSSVGCRYYPDESIGVTMRSPKAAVLRDLKNSGSERFCEIYKQCSIEQLFRKALQMAAGCAGADLFINPGIKETVDGIDRQDIENLAPFALGKNCSDSEIDIFIELAYTRSRSLLEPYTDAVRLIALELNWQLIIEPDEVKRIVQSITPQKVKK